MPRVIYRGDFNKVRVFFPDGSVKKITRGVVMEMSEELFKSLAGSESFEVVPEAPELKPELPIEEKKKDKHKSREVFKQ